MAGVWIAGLAGAAGGTRARGAVAGRGRVAGAHGEGRGRGQLGAAGVRFAGRGLLREPELRVARWRWGCEAHATKDTQPQSQQSQPCHPSPEARNSPCPSTQLVSHPRWLHGLGPLWAVCVGVQHAAQGRPSPAAPNMETRHALIKAPRNSPLPPPPPSALMMERRVVGSTKHERFTPSARRPATAPPSS